MKLEKLMHLVHCVSKMMALKHGNFEVDIRGHILGYGP